MGEEDPLFDDCVRFLEKMVNLKKNIYMKSYIGLSHGFLNYDYVGGLKPARAAIDDTIDELINFVKKIILG